MINKEIFIKIYKNSASFLSDILEDDYLLNKYEEYINNNKSIIFLKNELEKYYKDWELEYNKQLYKHKQGEQYEHSR